MIDKKLYRLLHWCVVLTIVTCVAIVIGVSQCQYSVPLNNETQEYNIHYLRRVNRALEEKKRESKLKTLEDSIHYFEDGM